MIVLGRFRSTVACSTQDSVSIRARASATENPRIGWPVVTPIAARSNGSGVLARPSMTMFCTRNPMTAVALPNRSRPVASVLPGPFECTRKATSTTATSPNAAHAAGRSNHLCRRSSSLRRAGRSLTLLRGRRAMRDMRHSPPSRRRDPVKLMPTCAACSGSSDVGVRPGCVFTSSSTRRPGLHAVSS